MCVSQKRKVHKSLRSKVYGETPAVETGLDKLCRVLPLFFAGPSLLRQKLFHHVIALFILVVSSGG